MKKKLYLSLLSCQRQEIVREIEKMRKTTGIKGILGTTHRDGVVNEGFNQAIDSILAHLKKKE